MQLYLLLNTDCNLNCGFCIRGKRGGYDYLDTDNLISVLNENDFSDYHLLITGGEPTLHPDLPYIISLCQKHFKSVSVNTNGLENSWINKCDNNHFHVQLSIDGTKELHNQLRGSGELDVYSKVMQTINNLNYNDITYNISTTVGENNYNNIKELCKQISKMNNIQYWKVSSMLPFGCADKKNVLSIIKWNDLVDYLLDNANVRLIIKRLFDFDLLEKYMYNNPTFYKKIKSNCGGVKYKIYVYPDFTVYPCTCLTDFPLGNLNDDSLTTIINNKEANVFSDYRVSNNSVCCKCKYLPICNGGCIGMSYYYFHEIGMGDYRCPIIQKKLHTI